MHRTIALMLVATLAPSTAAASGFVAVGKCSGVSASSSNAHLCACAGMAGRVNAGTASWADYLFGFTAPSGYVVGKAGASSNSCLDVAPMVNGAGVMAANAFADNIELATDDVAAAWTALGRGNSLSHTYSFSETRDSDGNLDTVPGGSHFITYGEPVGTSGDGPIAIVGIGGNLYDIFDEWGHLATVSSSSAPEGAFAEFNQQMGMLVVTTFHEDGSSYDLVGAGSGTFFQTP